MRHEYTLPDANPVFQDYGGIIIILLLSLMQYRNL